MLSARELEERDRAKRAVKKELFTKILTQMCRKIDMYHSFGRNECLMRIPEYTFGYPSFNMWHVTVYMHRQLSRLGYRASVLGEGVISVGWGPERKKPTKEGTATAVDDEEFMLPSLSNLKKAADSIRKKYGTPKVK